MKDVERWKSLLEFEIRACTQPGLLDVGTHLIAVVKKTIRFGVGEAPEGGCEAKALGVPILPGPKTSKISA